MSKIGQLKTSAPIEKAMREIRTWLSKLDVPGLSVNTNYDARANISLLNFKYNEKSYEFRSSQQNNARLNMHVIAKVMEYKVRSHLMGIEDFDKSMIAYLQLPSPEGYRETSTSKSEERYYCELGLDSTASNEEIEKAYKRLAKTWHPDMAGSKEAKFEFEKRFSKINEAYSEIKKERGMQ